MTSLKDDIEISLQEDPEAFFNIICSEKKYTILIQKKIEYLDRNYSLISKEDAQKKFFSILHDYMIFGNSYDLSILKPLDFIKKYDSLIPENQLIDVYFSLNNYDTALEFIKLKKAELSKCFKKYYIVFAEENLLNNIPISGLDYEMKAKKIFKEDTEKRQIYQVAGCYKEKKLKILLYRYFKDDVTFIFYDDKNNNIPLYGFWSNADWYTLEEIFIDLYENGEYEKIKIIVKEFVSYKFNFVPHFENKYPYNSYQFYGFIFLELISNLNTEYYHYYQFNDDISLIKDQEKFIIGNIEPSSIPSSYVLSNEFFANLKFLKNIPKKDLRNHPLYNKTFEVYLSFCKYFYTFNVLEYLFIFKRLFNRLIEGSSLIDMLQIRKAETLFHFYKTNEIVQFDDKYKITVDNINSYITKQYFALKELLIATKDTSLLKGILNYNLENLIAVNAICLISFYGFETSKKLLQLGFKIDILVKIANLNYEDEYEKTLFLNIIFNDLITFKENKDNLDILFNIFKHLKDEGYPHITLKKIIKRIKSFEYALLPNVECLKNNLLLLDLVSKGEPIDNKIEGIKLYNDYRLREYSSIPDVKGTYKTLKYETVDMHSPEIISNGIDNYLYPDKKVGSSCLTPAGKAASCLHHGAH